MITELLSIFIQAVSVGVLKRSHWCTCRMRDTKRRRCCCCSPTAASVQDSYCTYRCSCKGWLREMQGEENRSINFNRYVNKIKNETKQTQIQQLILVFCLHSRLIFNTYYTVGCCRLWGSHHRLILTGRGGRTGSSHCNVAQYIKY